MDAYLKSSDDVIYARLGLLGDVCYVINACEDGNVQKTGIVSAVARMFSSLFRRLVRQDRVETTENLIDRELKAWQRVGRRL